MALAYLVFGRGPGAGGFGGRVVVGILGIVGGWRAPFGGGWRITIQMRGHRSPRVRGDGCHEADIEPGVEHAGEWVDGIGWWQRGFAARASNGMRFGAIEFARERNARGGIGSRACVSEVVVVK